MILPLPLAATVAASLRVSTPSSPTRCAQGKMNQCRALPEHPPAAHTPALPEQPGPSSCSSCDAPAPCTSLAPPPAPICLTHVNMCQELVLLQHPCQLGEVLRADNHRVTESLETLVLYDEK
eukprot:520083-Rhodomonas_salina.2